MKISIIEDDLVTSNCLKTMILNIIQDVEVNIFNSIENFINQKIETNLLFLDINLGNSNGFNIFNMMKINFQVVVISGNIENAAISFEYDIFDYLRKPLDISRVRNVLSKFLLQPKHTNSIKKMILSIKDEYQIIEFDNIIKLNADGKYTIITLSNKKQIVSNNNLGYFQIILPNSFFFRIHHNCIVNLNKIIKISKGLQLNLVLENEFMEVVSQREKSNFLNVFYKI